MPRHIAIPPNKYSGPLSRELTTIVKRHQGKKLSELLPDKQIPFDDEKETVKAEKLIAEFLKGKRK
jgi:hypothetical protein